MKTLIVYYSFEGNTRFIAEHIRDAIGPDADLLELCPVKEISRGFSKYFWGGGQAMMKKKPALKPFNKNPDEYECIIFGTPVWAFTYAPPLATFFSNVTIANRMVALFCCHGGVKGHVFKHMRKQLEGNTCVGHIDFMEPLTHDKENNADCAAKWAKGLVQKMTT